jgi:hypothetical protein
MESRSLFSLLSSGTARFHAGEAFAYSIRRFASIACGIVADARGDVSAGALPAKQAWSEFWKRCGDRSLPVAGDVIVALSRTLSVVCSRCSTGCGLGSKAAREPRPARVTAGLEPVVIQKFGSFINGSVSR